MLSYQTNGARGQRFHKQVVALRRLRLWVQDREIGREIGSPRASVLLSFSAPDRAQLAGHRPADATIGPFARLSPPSLNALRLMERATASARGV